MTSNEGDIIKAALIEFTDQSSVANALQNSGTMLNGAQLRYDLQCWRFFHVLKPICFYVVSIILLTVF